MAGETRLIERTVFEPIDEELAALRRDGWRLIAAFRSSEFEVILKLTRHRGAIGAERKAGRVLVAS
jgi:hypothetical protein